MNGHYCDPARLDGIIDRGVAGLFFCIELPGHTLFAIRDRRLEEGVPADTCLSGATTQWAGTTMAKSATVTLITRSCPASLICKIYCDALLIEHDMVPK